jgi:hypothetical protein
MEAQQQVEPLRKGLENKSYCIWTQFVIVDWNFAMVGFPNGYLGTGPPTISEDFASLFHRHRVAKHRRPKYLIRRSMG